MPTVYKYLITCILTHLQIMQYFMCTFCLDDKYFLIYKFTFTSHTLRSALVEQLPVVLFPVVFACNLNTLWFIQVVRLQCVNVQITRVPWQMGQGPTAEIYEKDMNELIFY